MIRFGPSDVPEPEMVDIKPGEGIFPENFQMGSDSGDESPVRTVTLQRSFAIGVYEVTFDEFQAYVDATTGTNNPQDEEWGRGGRPVINVSWDDAQGYVRWLSVVTGKRFRLPTEAEWEYVARACGEPESACWGWDYWWGPEVDEDNGWANCDGCGADWEGKDAGKRTVAKEDTALRSNTFGLYHTAGNVWEWVEDCWHGSYEGAPDDGSAWLESEGSDCGRRVLRGGSWFNRPRHVRSANRSRFLSVNRNFYVGFRLAQDIEPD